MINPIFWNVIKVLVSIGILGMLAIGYFKPTNKTVYTQPVNQFHYYENLKVGFGGCARMITK